jgi:uncharacterized pyridoxal phosphate-dependent enzyme
MTDIFTRLALTPLINVSGTETPYGAAPAHVDVIRAASEILPHSVNMLELQRAASNTIARATGAEAGCVTGCTAASIAIAVAAAMTGRDLGKVDQLPDTRGMRNEVIMQRGHEVTYGQLVSQNIRLAGAKVVEIGAAVQCGLYQLQAARGEQTAAALFVVSHLTAQNRLIALDAFCQACHERKIPVIVNAASQPDPRIYLQAGADLVLFSAHKHFGGLTAGVIAGKKELVQACIYQGQGIGRPMKAGKEAVVGTIAALERSMAMDPLQGQKLLDTRLQRFQEKLAGVSGVSATRKGQQIELQISPAKARVTAWALAAALRSENPMIIVWDHLAEAGLITVTLSKVSDETAEYVAGRIAEICARATGDNPAAAPNITDRVLVELEAWPAKVRSTGGH